MITSLELRNFKAWERPGPIEFAPITAFFGSNSSGKTSFLQSLLLLRQTVDSADRGSVFDLGGKPSSLVDLGAFSDVVFNHEPGAELGIGVSWCLDEPFEVREPNALLPVVEGSDLAFSVVVGQVGLFPAVHHLHYSVGPVNFGLQRVGDVGYELRSDGYDFTQMGGRSRLLPPPDKFYSLPDQVRADYTNASFLSDLELQFELMCDRLFYLGPLRQHPQRQYTFSGGRPTDVGQRGELAVQALIAGRDRDVEVRVAGWLKELGLISSFAVEPLDARGTVFQVSVRKTPSSPYVLLTDVGFGVSQVLPVLVLLAYVPEGSTVLLEQPEIHLHPAVQSGLADVIIEAAREREVQVVVESHSEHLLMRLQRRIAEEKLASDDCRLHFCDGSSGRSTVERLELDAYGNIVNWPTDFFGDSFGEAAAMTRAAQLRAGRGQSE